MKERFAGELDKINPARLEGENSKLDDFFLVLGLIFNDLKGLSFMHELFLSYFEPPIEGEITVHTGNHVGQQLHIFRLYTGHIHEFLNFLEAHKGVLASNEFRSDILARVPSNPRHTWEEIENIALEKTTDADQSTFAKILKKVRNNSSYHYSQSGKILRKGFHSFFFGQEKILGSEYAYYSLGDNMRTTRFLYVDAAIRNYLLSEAKQDAKSDAEALVAFNEHLNNLQEMVDAMNTCIYFLMKKYLKSRPHIS